MWIFTQKENEQLHIGLGELLAISETSLQIFTILNHESRFEEKDGNVKMGERSPRSS